MNRDLERTVYDSRLSLNQEWLERAQYVLHNPQILKSWVRGLRNSRVPDFVLAYMKPALLNAYVDAANNALNQSEGQRQFIWQRSHLLFYTDEKGKVRNLSFCPDVNKYVEDHLRNYIVDLFDRENIWEEATRWYFNNSVVWTLEAMAKEYRKGINPQAWALIYSKTLCYCDGDRFQTMFDIYAKNFVQLYMQDFTNQAKNCSMENLLLFEKILGLNKEEAGPQAKLQLSLAKETASYLTTFSMARYQQLRKVIATQSLVPDKSIWPSASLQTPSGSSQGYVLLQAPEEQASEVKDLLEGMNDETVDVIDALCHLWLKKGKAQAEEISVQADDILELRGLRKQKNGQGQRGGYKNEWRERIAKHLEILDHLWINPSPEFSAPTEKAFIIARDKSGSKKGNQGDYVWKVRLGDILLRDLQEGKRQTALLSAKVLELDPYRQAYEKRAARYFSWLWRSRQSRAQYLNPIRVSTLLEAVQLKYDKSRSAKIHERFEKMLDVLRDKEIIANWQYDKGYERTKNWVEWKVVIEPPQIIMDQYAKIKCPYNTHKTANKAELTPSEVGDRLKKERLKRRMTQLQVAELLGIEQTTLSKIELGRLKPDPRTLSKLQQWLNVSTL